MRVSPGLVVTAIAIASVAVTVRGVPTGLPTWVHVVIAFLAFLAADATASTYRIGRIDQVRHWTPGVFAAAWVLAPGVWLLLPVIAASTVLNVVKVMPRGFAVVPTVARRCIVISAAVLTAHAGTVTLVHSGVLTSSGPRALEGKLALALGGVVGGVVLAAVFVMVDNILFGETIRRLKPSTQRQLLRAGSVSAIGAVAAWLGTTDPVLLLFAVPVLASYVWHTKRAVAASYASAWEAELLASRLLLDVSYPIEAVHAHATRRVLPYATHIQVTPRDTRSEAWQIREGHLVLGEVDVAGTAVLEKVQNTTEDVVTEKTDDGLWVAVNFGASAEDLTSGVFVTFMVPTPALHRRRHALDMARAAVLVGSRLRQVANPKENRVDPAIRLSAHRMLELLNRDAPGDRANRREVLTELHRLELLVARHMGGRADETASVDESVGYVSAGHWTLPQAGPSGTTSR